jgi:energy-coupling factor transporter ATP-binding protein EcfA2
MSKAHTEFKSFIQKNITGFSDYEKKLVKLILDNFSNVESTGSAGGKRGKAIAKLIAEAGDSATSDLKIENGAASSNANRVNRLTEIKVEHFRGFSNKQTLQFKNLYTFVYGPNGTGKSSLCEALEFSLLGTITEAEAKRIEIGAYIKNAITKKSQRPVLSAVAMDGSIVVVNPDPKNFEFCFIEKNRIDGFARVAANTAQAQQSRLAALFGLEEFNTFANQFNDNFDTYIDCVGKKSKELSDKEKQIAGHKANLLQMPQKEKDIKTREEILLLKFANCKSLEDVKAEISGTDEVAGTLKKNNTEIGRLANLKSAIDPGISAISEEVKALTALIQERKEAKQFLSMYKEQLSLGDLYAAILKNQERYRDNCPACESLLFKDGLLAVPVNPYENATEKLKQFEVALNKEKRIREITALLEGRWPVLASRITNLYSAASQVNFAQIEDVSVLRDLCEGVVGSLALEGALNQLLQKVELFADIKASIAAFNLQIGTAKAAIPKIEAENKKLTTTLEEIASMKTIAKEIQKNFDAANLAIEKFKTENEVLIKEVEIEKIVVARNHQYLVAYESFREKLLRFNSNLPLALAVDLNDKTLKFYNAINRHDHISDQLKSLTLPTAVGKKIEIEFHGGERCDALQILSEGHIRCLGLAILLSKIVREDLPFLIFDDVVNSIDDEHRTGVVELLLGDGEIKNRQLIITTHGEEFVKRLENAVPKKEYAKTVSRIDFLVPIEAKTIVIKLESARHYLVVAEQSYAEGKVRDCLSYMRKSLEELLNRLWKKISEKSHVAQFLVGMRGPNSSPDLMSIATGLHGFLQKKEVSIYQQMIPPLEQILGKETKYPVEWNCLNKGTHEADLKEEFDAPAVKALLSILIEMDTAFSSGAMPAPVPAA